MSTGCREQVVELLEKYSLGSPLIDERMMDWLRLFYTYSRVDIEAENAALKEQVAQLEFRNERLVADYAELQGLNENHAFNAKYFKAASEKSAALVDALEGLLSLDEENHQRYPGDEDVCLEVRNARAALAEFKGEK